MARKRRPADRPNVSVCNALLKIVKMTSATTANVQVIVGEVMRKATVARRSTKAS